MVFVKTCLIKKPRGYESKGQSSDIEEQSSLQRKRKIKEKAGGDKRSAGRLQIKQQSTE